MTRPARADDKLPIAIELNLFGLDQGTRSALNASIAANARRAFAPFGDAVRSVSVGVTRALYPLEGEVWEVTVDVTFEGSAPRTVHARSAARRPHVALEEAMLDAWTETNALASAAPAPGATRAVA